MVVLRVPYGIIANGKDVAIVLIIIFFLMILFRYLCSVSFVLAVYNANTSSVNSVINLAGALRSIMNFFIKSILQRPSDATANRLPYRMRAHSLSTMGDLLVVTLLHFPTATPDDLPNSVEKFPFMLSGKEFPFRVLHI